MNYSSYHWRVYLLTLVSLIEIFFCRSALAAETRFFPRFKYPWCASVLSNVRYYHDSEKTSNFDYRFLKLLNQQFELSTVDYKNTGVQEVFYDSRNGLSLKSETREAILQRIRGVVLPKPLDSKKISFRIVGQRKIVAFLNDLSTVADEIERIQTKSFKFSQIIFGRLLSLTRTAGAVGLVTFEPGLAPLVLNVLPSLSFQTNKISQKTLKNWSFLVSTRTTALRDFVTGKSKAEEADSIYWGQNLILPKGFVHSRLNPKSLPIPNLNEINEEYLEWLLHTDGLIAAKNSSPQHRLAHEFFSPQYIYIDYLLEKTASELELYININISERPL